MKRIQTGSVGYFFLLAVFTVVYFVVGKAGLRFASLHPSASAIWPPTGIAIAGTLIFGYYLWPAIFLGAFLVNITTAGTVFTSLGIATGNTLEAMLAAYLVIRYCRGLHAFDHPANIFRYTFIAGFISTAVSATVGVASLTLGGFAPISQLGSIWFTWWLGDMGGALVIAPFILLWYQDHRISWNLRQIVEFFIVIALLIGMSTVVFFTEWFPHPYIILPIVLWVAFRFRQRETAAVIGILSMVAILGTLQNKGPFAMTSHSANAALVQVQIFMTVVAATKLIIAATVDERRHVQALLAEREAHFKALIEHSADVIVLVDAHANILYTSPSTERVLGFSPGELKGTNGFSLVHPEDLPLTQKILQQLIKKPNTIATTEFRLKHKTGRWVWAEATGTNLLEEPAVRAIVINYHDVTDRRELEQAKEEFLMIAAHELRSPLSSMRWNMEAILSSATKIPEKLRRNIEQTYENNNRMIQLVNELVDVSRIVQGKIPDSPQEIYTADILQKEIDTIQSIAKQRGIKIMTEKNIDTIPPILLDSQKFSTVIRNLLSNAVKYNVADGRVVIDMKKEENDLVFSVGDTGIGIPKEEQHKLFTKFFRASNAVTQEAQGTGLGLFVVKSYVDLWGGKIFVTSPTQAGNRGTNITIRLPVTYIHKHSKKENA